MGKKKSQNRVQQSMGQLVSKAALTQMLPQIEQIVKFHMGQLGNQLAVQQASTLETLFTRVVVLEQIVIDKLGYTIEELANKVANLEDEKENLLATSEAVEMNDVVRLEVLTKTKEQTEFQGSSRLKIYETGSGQTLGAELESSILGMKAGETKEVSFGKDGLLTAKLNINRVSRSTKAPQGESSEPKSEG